MRAGIIVALAGVLLTNLSGCAPLGSPATFARIGEMSKLPASNSQRVYIGQSIAEAQAQLAEAHAEFGEGNYEFAASNEFGHPQLGTMRVVFDHDRSEACVYFDSETQAITQISMIFYPGLDRRLKVSQTWVPAEEIALHKDGSYSVQFARPLTAERRR